MRLNLSDAVDDLAPLEPPPCFHNRESWLQYLKSAAATQNHRANQKVIMVDEDRRPRFNERLNYCADCTQAKSLEMLNRGRCDPYHLSEHPDRPDGDGVLPAAAPVKVDTGRRSTTITVPPSVQPGDAFTRLVGFLMMGGKAPVAWGSPEGRVTQQ